MSKTSLTESSSEWSHRRPTPLPPASLIAAMVSSREPGHSELLLLRVRAVTITALRGGLPNDLPIEQPTKFELAVNLKSAKKMGLSIPEAFLTRADALLEWVQPIFCADEQIK
jgi:hypothetical protein